MAKESGLGWTTFTISSNDIRNDVTSLEISTPRETQDVTGIDKSAMERLLLLADGTLSLNFVFNDAASQIHATLKDVATATAAKATALAVSSQTLSMNLLYTDYKLNRADDGSFTGSSEGVLSDGTAPAWS